MPRNSACFISDDEKHQQLTSEKRSPSPVNNQKQSSEFNYLVAAKRLLRFALAQSANRKSLTGKEQPFSGAAAVLNTLAFRLKNLNYWAGFQEGVSCA
jgi:hypothetical protein